MSVEFDTDPINTVPQPQYAAREVRPERKPSFVARFLIRRGLAHTPEQVTAVLVLIVGLLFLVAFAIYGFFSWERQTVPLQVKYKGIKQDQSIFPKDYIK